MTLSRFLIVGVALLLLLGVPSTYAGSFYLPSTSDVNLLEKIETKIQKFQEEKLQSLEEKVKELTVHLILTPRGTYIIDTVIAMVAVELERRVLIASQPKVIAEDDAKIQKKMTLQLSDNHKKLFKKLEGYRFNR